MKENVYKLYKRDIEKSEPKKYQNVPMVYVHNLKIYICFEFHWSKIDIAILTIFHDYVLKK